MKFFSKTPKAIELPLSLIDDTPIPGEFIKQLQRRGYKTTEEDLLRCIRENKAKTLVYYAVICLKQYGSSKSIEVLKEMTEYPKEDVKVCAVLSIGRLAGKNETPYYAELLDSKFRGKDFVMAVIWQVGDKRAYNAVLRYANKVLAGKVTLHTQSDVLYIVRYLEKHSPSEADWTVMRKLLELIDNYDSY